MNNKKGVPAVTSRQNTTKPNSIIGFNDLYNLPKAFCCIVQPCVRCSQPLTGTYSINDVDYPSDFPECKGCMVV